MNSAAVFALCLQLGIDEQKIRQSFKSFEGIKRRCERVERSSLLFIDDYGHHPTEIEVTIRGIKESIKERRLIVLFQPHRFTRTKDLFAQFTQCFRMADRLIVTDIYAASEKPIEGVTAALLAEKITNIPCNYIAKEKLFEKVVEMLEPHDVVLTIGAGDITGFHKKFSDHFAKHSLKKLRVGVLFGGKSCEHPISMRSARFVSSSCNKELYDLSYFGIDQQGNWIAGDEAKKILEEEAAVNTPHAKTLSKDIVAKLEECDLFLPILHGPYGEDGSMQGFFEILGKPYVGPDFRSASIAMDKAMTKRCLKACGVPTPEFLSFGSIDWQRKKEEILGTIQSQLQLPLFIKGVHLGSSIGTTRIEKYEELTAAIETALAHDMIIMVEEGKDNCRELEFAVVGNDNGFDIRVPIPGEKLAGGKLVDYEMKYGKEPVKTTITPELSAEQLEKGKAVALAAYRAIGCSNMARVDCLLDANGDFWCFEINPIPGMQQFSLFPKIWNRDGYSPDKLIDLLIILARHRRFTQDRHLV